jgi:uncharacterized membrane protein
LRKVARGGPPKSQNKKKTSTRSPIKNTEVVALLVLIAISTLLMLPAMLGSFPNGDDVAQHYWWSRLFTNEIVEGNLYPRWLSAAYDGRGSPVMFFYPPLPFFVITLFNLLVRDPLWALLLGYWLGLTLSGLTMYLLARLLLSPWESLSAATFYIAAHYHLFDFYHRSAQHEFWAFVWVPILLYGFYRTLTELGWRPVPWIAIGYSLLLVTHLPSALIATVMLPVFAILVTRDVRPMIRAAAGLALGFGIAAIFVLPYLLERGYLKPLGQRTEIQSFRAGFLLENLLTSFTQIPFPSSGNFHLFILASNWMAAATLLLLVVCSWILWKSEWKQNYLIRAVWVTTVFSFVMTTRISMPIWQFVPKIKAIQFPIRWFVITILGISLLSGAVSSLIIRRQRLPAASTLIFACVVVANLVIGIIVLARAPYQPDILRTRLAYYTDVREYHPRWWDQKRHAEFDQQPVVADPLSAQVTVIKQKGTNQGYVVESDRETTLRFRTLYFPGWRANVNGLSTPVSPGSDGHIELTLSPGRHTVALGLGDTPPRLAGKVVSGVSLLLFAGLVYAVRRRKESSESPKHQKKSAVSVRA